MTMVERVTDAICRVQIPIMQGNDAVGVQQLPRRFAVYVARAAIEAMMTPTPAMVDAAWAVSEEAFDDTEVYQAMLTAALQEPV